MSIHPFGNTVQQVNVYMNPHVKSLLITPVINKFPVISRHNSPCCFRLLPTALEIMPVPFVAGSSWCAEISALHQATFLLADSYTLPSTNHKIKADFYLLCKNSTILEQWEILEAFRGHPPLSFCCITTLAGYR